MENESLISMKYGLDQLIKQFEEAEEFLLLEDCMINFSNVCKFLDDHCCLGSNTYQEYMEKAHVAYHNQIFTISSNKVGERFLALRDKYFPEAVYINLDSNINPDALGHAICGYFKPGKYIVLNCDRLEKVLLDFQLGVKK